MLFLSIFNFLNQFFTSSDFKINNDVLDVELNSRNLKNKNFCYLFSLVVMESITLLIIGYTSKTTNNITVEIIMF